MPGNWPPLPAAPATLPPEWGGFGRQWRLEFCAQPIAAVSAAGTTSVGVAWPIGQGGYLSDVRHELEISPQHTVSVPAARAPAALIDMRTAEEHELFGAPPEAVHWPLAVVQRFRGEASNPFARFFPSNRVRPRALISWPCRPSRLAGSAVSFSYQPPGDYRVPH